MRLQSDINGPLTPMIKASINAFIPGCIPIILYEDVCVKYVKCLMVAGHLHLIGI